MSPFADIERLRAWRRATGISEKRLAIMADVEIVELKDMMSTAWSPDAETLRALLRLVPSSFMGSTEKPLHNRSVDAGSVHNRATAGQSEGET